MPDEVPKRTPRETKERVKDNGVREACRMGVHSQGTVAVGRGALAAAHAVHTPGPAAPPTTLCLRACGAMSAMLVMLILQVGCHRVQVRPTTVTRHSNLLVIMLNLKV